MKRSAVLGIALLGTLGEMPAGAQQTGKTYRVGIISSGIQRTISGQSNRGAFLGALSGLGYQQGKNLEIIQRTVTDVTLLPELAADLVREKPDVIVAGGNLVIAALQRATTSVPIVMTQNADPVGVGFIASLAHPGGNISGATNMNAALVGKQLQLLKELVPHLRRVVVVRDPASAANLLMWREAESLEATIGAHFVALDIRSANEIDRALSTLPHFGADAVFVFADNVINANGPRIVRLVAAQRLPAMYQDSGFTAAGGLMSYGADPNDSWRRAATYVARILKGAKPADLPVAQPTVFELVVNLKAAHAIGITVPQSILVRADQVIR